MKVRSFSFSSGPNTKRRSTTLEIQCTNTGREATAPAGRFGEIDQRERLMRVTLIPPENQVKQILIICMALCRLEIGVENYE